MRRRFRLPGFEDISVVLFMLIMLTLASIFLMFALRIGEVIRHDRVMHQLLEECVKAKQCPHPDACKEVGR